MTAVPPTRPGDVPAGKPGDREVHLVELVDEQGRAVGSSTVDEAHRSPGRLHRAFSVMLRDPRGRLLLQRRAEAKTRFPLRWANTCCGHPAPGETLAAAAARRLAEEVGVTGVTLTPVGTFIYRAVDPATGRVEYEYDHVLVGDFPSGARPAPDPGEVSELRWDTPGVLLTRLADRAGDYAPWLGGVLSVLRDGIDAHAESAGADGESTVAAGHVADTAREHRRSSHTEN